MHSKCRPPSGERCRLIVGPRTTSTPLRTASPASRPPIRCSSSSSHEAAIAELDGNVADGSSSVSVPPRTPIGPSETVIERNPISGAGCVVQTPAPDSNRTFVSRSNFPTRPSRSRSRSVRSPDEATALLEAGGFFAKNRARGVGERGGRARGGSEGGDLLGVVAGGEALVDQPQRRALGHADLGGQRAPRHERAAGRRGRGSAGGADPECLTGLAAGGLLGRPRHRGGGGQRDR